jgi:hypothetical protein
MLPKPVKAVLLLFPISDALESKRKKEEEKIAKEGQPSVDPTVFWIKQTVRSFLPSRDILQRCDSQSFCSLDLECVRDHRTSSRPCERQSDSHLP